MSANRKNVVTSPASCPAAASQTRMQHTHSAGACGLPAPHPAFSPAAAHLPPAAVGRVVALEAAPSWPPGQPVCPSAHPLPGPCVRTHSVCCVHAVMHTHIEHPSGTPSRPVCPFVRPLAAPCSVHTKHAACTGPHTAPEHERPPCHTHRMPGLEPPCTPHL